MARRTSEAGAPVTVQQLRVQGQQRFVDKSAALKRALTAHKHATTVNSHQSEWRLEHSRLAVGRQQAEAELLSAMQQLATSAYSQHCHSQHDNVHQLARDLTAALDDRRQAEQSRHQWAAQMSQPRERARSMMAEARSKARTPERETRLMAAQRAAERTALGTSLQQLMHGLRHQCTVLGDELERLRSAAEADLAAHDSDWLARMSDDRIEQPANSADALLAVDARWLSSVPAERRDELEGARRQWSDRWVERRDMMDRLFAHKRDHARQLLSERVAALKRFGGNYDVSLTEEHIEDDQQASVAQPIPAAAVSSPTTPDTSASNTAPTKRAIKSAAASSTRPARHPWDSCDQRLLLHIVAQYTAAGKQRRQLVDRLTLEFKHVAGDELRLRLDCAVQQRLCADQLRAVDADWRLARWELDEEVDSGWAAELGRLKDHWRRADEATERDRELEARHADLQQMRAVKDEESRAGMERKERDDRAQAETDRQREEDERTRREEAKRQLAQYEAKQCEEREKVQRIVAAEQKRDDDEKDEIRLSNAARLAARQQLEADKQKQQQLEAERHAEGQREKERRLEALRQSVAPHVTVDRQRVQAPTVSSLAERDADGRLFRVDGWSNEAVFSDPRAKLSAALHAAGIPISGDYAREVLGSMGAGREARRGMESTWGGDAVG